MYALLVGSSEAIAVGSSTSVLEVDEVANATADDLEDVAAVADEACEVTGAALELS